MIRVPTLESYILLSTVSELHINGRQLQSEIEAEGDQLMSSRFVLTIQSFLIGCKTKKIETGTNPSTMLHKSVSNAATGFHLDLSPCSCTDNLYMYMRGRIVSKRHLSETFMADQHIKLMRACRYVPRAALPAYCLAWLIFTLCAWSNAP